MEYIFTGIIEAKQFDPEDLSEFIKFLDNGRVDSIHFKKFDCISITEYGIDGRLYLYKGDWLVRTSFNFIVCSDEVFTKNFKQVK